MATGMDTFFWLTVIVMIVLQTIVLALKMSSRRLRKAVRSRAPQVPPYFQSLIIVDGVKPCRKICKFLGINFDPLPHHQLDKTADLVVNNSFITIICYGHGYAPDKIFHIRDGKCVAKCAHLAFLAGPCEAFSYEF